jgi:O-antigen/teichoic acid export membrane protein
MASEPATTGAPSLASQVSRAVVWNTVFVPLRLLAEVLSTLVKLNLLTPASYGLLALISGANNGLGTAVDLGVQRALPKYIPELNRSGGPRAVLRLLTAVFAAQMAVLAVLALALATLLREPYLGTLRAKVLGDGTLIADDRALLLDLLAGGGWLVIAAILALLFLGVLYDMLMAYLNSFFRQRAWNSITLAAGLLPQLLSVAAILLLPEQLAILGVLAATVFAPAIAVGLAGWQVGRMWQHQELRAGEPRAGEPSTDAVAAATSSAGGALVPVPGSWFSRWLPPGFVRYTAVSFLMTATDFIASAGFAIYLAGDIGDVALIAAGAALARMALGYLYTPMVGVQVPLFTRVRQGEGGTLDGAYQSLVRLQLLLLVPGGVGLMLLAEPALLVLGPQYVEATAIVWVLVPCLFAECLLTTAHNALIVYEHLPLIVASRILTLLVVAPLAWLLPPAYGLIGVALAFGLARVAAGAWVTVSGSRTLGLRWPWRFTLRVAAASAVMALVVLAVRGLLPAAPEEAGLAERLREAVLLLGVAAVGATSFLAALRLTGGLDPRDREQLARIRLPGRRWILKLL